MYIKQGGISFGNLEITKNVTKYVNKLCKAKKYVTKSKKIINFLKLLKFRFIYAGGFEF